MSLGIIMPVWIQNQPMLDLTYRAAQSLQCSSECRLFVVTNRLHGILPEDFQRDLSARCSVAVRLLHEPGVERSVAGAWNHGIRTAIADGCGQFLIAANDAIHEPDCIDRLSAFGNDPANATISIWSGIDTRDKPNIDPAAVSEGSDFTCLMFRRETLDNFGWFDERYRPAYWEDNDYAARVWVRGGECRVVHAARFFHHGSMTTRLDPEAAHHCSHWFHLNRRRFAEKWGTPTPAHSKDEALRIYFRVPWNDPCLSVSDWDR